MKTKGIFLHLLILHLTHFAVGVLIVKRQANSSDPSEAIQDIEIQEQPFDVSAFENEEVELPCVFNTAVECIWYKDNREVKVARNYQYKNRNETETTSDCTLVIKAAELFDNGQWKCSNKASLENSTVYSETATVKIHTLKILVQPQPLSTVEVGEIVQFDCGFNTAINCIWMKDGEEMNVEDFYIDKSTKGQNTTDCSISFAVEESDEGNWTCYSHNLKDWVKSKIKTIAQSQVVQIKFKHNFNQTESTTTAME